MNFNFFLVDLYRKTQVEKDYNFLMKSQWWSYDEIKNYQTLKLRELIQYSYKNVKYYRKLFDDYGLKPNDIKSYEDLSKIPILTKEIIKENSLDLISTRAKTYGMWPKNTGGSTGMPLKYFLSYKALSLEFANRLRAYSQAGYKIGDKIIYFGGPSLFGKIDLKRKIYFKLYNLVPLDSFQINEEKLSQSVRLIKKSKAKIMFSYASSAETLARFILENDIKDMKFDGVFTTSEVLFENARNIIEEAFHCKVFNLYGANDGSVAAFECDNHNGLHIASERAIIEVIDDEGNQVEKGLEGNVVTTDLTNYSMPFIRYKLNDIVSFSNQKCLCKRGLPLLGEIKGRTSDFILDNNNNKIHGEFFSHVFSKYSWIKQFQVIQKNKTNLTILLLANGNRNTSEVNEIAEIFKKKFNGMSIEINFVDKIDASKNGKQKFIFSEI